MMKRLAWSFLVLACCGRSAPARAGQASSTIATKAAAPALTENAIRTLVRKAHWDLRHYALRLFERADKSDEIAECFGNNAAVRLAKVSEVRTVLAKYVTGHATQCYQTSYFGCTVGEWIGFAGPATQGPESVAYLESKVVVLERSTDRVVADVWEPTSDYISEAGVFDEKRYAERLNKDRDRWKSRYTFVKSTDGTWLIADRVPNFDWECGDGEPQPLRPVVK